MYDIFYISENNDLTDFQRIKLKFPRVQLLTGVKSFEEISNKSFTKMFWIVWDDLIVNENFNFDNYTATKWDDMYVHVFRNGEHFDGIGLFPKSLKITKKEFYHRFFTEKKEIDITASRPSQFKIYKPASYEEYIEIKDEMFWVIWPEVKIIDKNIFDLYFSHHNSYDRRENHVFKNSCNGSESYINGITLISKFKPISKKEFDNRYVIDKKEHNILVSKSQYPIYHLKSYDDYLKIINSEQQSLFWGVWPEIEIIDETIFDLYYDPRDGKYEYDRKENHIFKHMFNDKEIFVNGLVLFSKHKPIGKKEFIHRFLIEKKEHNLLVSKHKPYDVIFISYNESNADENYQRLLDKCPKAKRVHGVRGIHQAHIAAASLCESDMFWVVDGDAFVNDDFNFDLSISTYDLDCVHVWRSKNPINDLEYGNGGIKLLPRKLTLEMDINTPDMTTSISKKFKAMSDISNLTMFNTDPFNTWKSAFRECVKLSSRSINRQDDNETSERLNVWCTKGEDRPFGKYAIRGANEGRTFGEAHKSEPEILSRINDFEWLKRKFDEV